MLSVPCSLLDIHLLFPGSTLLGLGDEGGAVIDTQANFISIKQPLVSGAAADGGLTKKGTGVLSLLSTNSYNGPTVITGGTLTFDPQANTQTLYNTVTCADTNGTLIKAGIGRLVLNPGAAATNTFGTLWCTNGTMVLASGTNQVTRYCGVQNGPGLRISGGTLLLAGGVLKTTAGLFVNVDGGTLLITNGLADFTSCNELLNGIGSAYGYTTVSGSGVLIVNTLRISQNGGSPSNMVVTVSTGGVLRLNQFYIDINATQKGMLILNGGMIEPRTDNAYFLGTTEVIVGNNNDHWLTNIFVQVREGGAVFDTAGKSISIRQPLYSGAASDGGLTVYYGVAPGSTNSIGTLTLAMTPSLSGTLLTDVALDGSCDRLHVQGDLDLSALALAVADTGLLNKNKRYVIATCTGTLTNSFTSAPLPPR